MVYNNLKGILKCAAVNIPWAGGVERDNLEDIATLTGARLIDNQHDVLLEDITLEHFGRAKLIKINEYETNIVDGAGSSNALNLRYEQIK